MSSQSPRPTPAEIVGELTQTLRALRRELRDANGRGGRGLDRLVRFTSEVTIPATILVLETNIRALRLLQRTLRLARDAEEGATTTEATTLGRSVVDRIDEALGEAQSTVEETSADEEAGELLEEAKELNRQLAARLEADDAGERFTTQDDGETASVDVESELASLKDRYDDGSDDENDTDDVSSKD